MTQLYQICPLITFFNLSTFLHSPSTISVQSILTSHLTYCKFTPTPLSAVPALNLCARVWGNERGGGRERWEGEERREGGRKTERKRLREEFSPEWPFLFPTILSCVPVTVTQHPNPFNGWPSIESQFSMLPTHFWKLYFQVFWASFISFVVPSSFLPFNFWKH